MTTLLLVHGAYHGRWCWDRLIPELADLGIPAEAVHLPLTTPEADTATVTAAIDRLTAAGERVVLLGHSFGGSVISAVADAGASSGTSPAHLVYLTAVLLCAEHDVEFEPSPGMAAMLHDGDTMSVDPDLATLAFYHRCEPADAAWAIEQLRPMPAALFAMGGERSRSPIPTTYIVCTDDQIISEGSQRQMAAAADSSVDIDADHSPFLSAPGALAALLAPIVRSA
ncbi:MAG: putative esterase [Actinomycetia bacterium]|nr:putative esterase [Actinomycetes bacterium]